MNQDEQAKLIEFLKDPKNADAIRKQVSGDTSSDIEVPEISVPEDASVEEVTKAYNKALKKLASDVKRLTATQQDEMRKVIMDSQKSDLQTKAVAFGKKHPLFQEALDGKHPELFKDMNSLMSSGVLMEDAFDKALKANGIEEKTFLDQQKAEAEKKERPQPDIVAQQSTAQGPRPPDESQLTKPQAPNIKSAAKEAFDEILNGKTLQEIGMND